MDFQHTIGDEVYVKGIGLHTGNLCQAVFKPAPPNTGVVLVRTDLLGNLRSWRIIPTSWE